MASKGKSADATILKLLRRIERIRPLDDEESRLMESLILRSRPRKQYKWRWTQREDDRLLRVIRERARQGRPKPFEPNNEIRDLAIDLGRSYMAVHRRMERLRKRRPKRENCSIAVQQAAE